MYTQEADGTIVDSDGKIIYFSLDRFINDICLGDKCFICGKDPSETEFNDEHIIPDWLIRKHNLANKYITLPNLSTFQYGQYKIKCCSACNSDMGEIFEKPIRKIFTNFETDSSYSFSREDTAKIYIWFNLIFTKTHLKDSLLNDYKSHDRRLKISQKYDWSKFHHIHCIARSFYTQAVLGPGIYGSFFKFRIRDDSYSTSFDFIDNFDTRTMLFRSNNIGFCLALHDSGIGGGFLPAAIQNLDLSTPISALQLREIFARLSFINSRLKHLPIYRSCFSPNSYEIVTYIPDIIELDNSQNKDFGEIMYSCCIDYIPTNIANYKELIGNIKSGAYTFLQNEDGNFITNSI